MVEEDRALVVVVVVLVVALRMGTGIMRLALLAWRRVKRNRAS